MVAPFRFICVSFILFQVEIVFMQISKDCLRVFLVGGKSLSLRRGVENQNPHHDLNLKMKIMDSFSGFISIPLPVSG
jgi:hypothetical protein